ncbi:MAG: 23S rRNA (adenine(2503)-C(2))-methyltransferase RlmN [Ruminococcaceae bacterium]|nr:23S rRNA (adenine(2503)-C(2))-methyltransferase RlmN [Oscillospiraceae bacterium]
MTTKFDIYSMTKEELCAMAEELGEKAFRGKQIFGWLYSGADSFEDMTNLPKSFRQKLAERCLLYKPVIHCKQVSRDGTVKYAFRLADGEIIESVVMSYHHGYTICVSTQAGCNMGCRFCATAVGGKARDLTAGEMLGQIMVAQQDLSCRIGNVVLMGMGEPLDNLEQVLRFMAIANHEEGFCIGYRHFTLSTCGLCDKIKLLADKNLPITLSVSVHSPFNEERSAMMPVNKKFPLEILAQTLLDYQKQTGRRISLEYALIKDKNDSPAHAKALMELFSDLSYHVNVIPVNEAREGFHKGDKESLKRFLDCFTRAGIAATTRRELGADISAACGQLKHQVKQKEIEK